MGETDRTRHRHRRQVFVSRRKPVISSRRLDLFAGVAVSDFSTALPWYGKLFGGPPSFLAHDTEAVWELAPRRYVYIVETQSGAGHARATIFLSHLDLFLSRARRRGVEPHALEWYPNRVRKVTFRDADGNELAFGGAMRPDPQRTAAKAPAGRTRSTSVH